MYRFRFSFMLVCVGCLFVGLLDLLVVDFSLFCLFVVSLNRRAYSLFCLGGLACLLALGLLFDCLGLWF